MDQISVYCDRGHDETRGVVVWFNGDGIGYRWIEHPDMVERLEIRRQFLHEDEFHNDRKHDHTAQFGDLPRDLRYRFAMTCMECGYRVEREGSEIERMLTKAHDARVSRVSLRMLG